MRRSRPQFHLVIVLIVWWPFFLLLTYGLSWIVTGIHWLAGERVTTTFPVTVLMSGLAVVGEWVRGVVKTGWGKAADQRSFVATGITGAVVGALFDGYMAIMWGNDGWREMLIAASIGAAAYLAIDACFRWEERRKGRASVG